MACGRVESIGFVGAGWVARNCYLPAARALGLQVGFVIDPAVDRMAAAGQFDARHHATTVSGFRGEPVDLVVIATPNASHCAASREALAHGLGRQVLCEKNLARSLAEAEALLACPGADRLWLSTPFRFRDDVQQLFAAVAAGAVGQPRRVRASWRRRQGVPRPGSWYTREAISGGGVMADLGPHLLDAGLRLLQPGRLLDSLCWTGRSPARARGAAWMDAVAHDAAGVVDVEDQVSASFRFDEGRLLQVEASWTGFRRDETVLEIEGASGVARLTTLFGYAQEGPPEYVLETDTETGSAIRRGALLRRPERDFARMLTAIAGSPAAGSPACTAREGLRTVELIEQAYLRAAA